MIKSISKLLLVAVLAIGTTHMAFGFIPDGIESEVTNAVTLNVSQTAVRVTGAQGQTLEIYNITGVQVEKIKIDSNDKKIELNLPKGCYILKVGKLVRKVSIR